jgi:hypothetical protein
MTSFEEQLVRALERKSAEAPPTGQLVEAARMRHRRRRRALLCSGAALAIAVVLVPAGVLANHGLELGPSGGTGPVASSATTTTPSGSHDGPGCAELTGPLPVPATPAPPVPDAAAQHLAINESGTVAAWFNETGRLPELVVFDLTNNEELAREDLGVGEVAPQPSLRILGQALYFRSAEDHDVWVRYAWHHDGYPLVYTICN